MTEEIKTQKSTSKVIDSLHSQIDELRNELEVLKLSHNEHKKRNTILSTKNDSLVDQLANYKHENDMINALLKRKERRINDLEEEFDSLSSESELLKLSVKNYKIRCENLQDSLSSQAAEFERLKIAYDAIVAAQLEYKRHYLEEVSNLTNELANYKTQSASTMADFMAKIESNDKDVDVLLDGLSSKRKALDNIYFSRNKTVMELLSQLARASKVHGEESRSILRDNVQIINLLRQKMPELEDAISERTETPVDLDSLLGDTSSCLDLDFADFSTSSVTSEDTFITSRFKHSKKNNQRKSSSRMSPETPDGNFSEVLPKSRQTQKSLGGRVSSGDHKLGSRQSSHSQQRPVSMSGGNSRVSSTGSNRSSYGGPGSPSLDGHGSHNGNTNSSRNTSNGTNQNKHNVSRQRTQNNNIRNTKKGSPSPLTGSSGLSQQSNKNNKRRLVYGGNNTHNMNSNEHSPNEQRS